FVERHREISKREICFPSCNDLALFTIDYCNVSRIRHVDENSVLFQFECFGMGRKLDRADLFAVSGVDDGNSAAAEADINFFRGFVVANVVRIVFEIQFADWLQRLPVIDFENPAFVVRDNEAIKFGKVNNSLRRTEAGDGTNSFTFTKIDNFDGVISERGDE